MICKNKAGRIIEAELSAELPLGIMPQVDYKDVKIDLEKGDKIIVFTDGLTEARNREKREFGMQKTKEIILKNAGSDSQGTVESIKNELFAFSRAMPQADDITLIVVSVGK